MAFQQLITPNLGYRALAGLCLVMAQGITGAPVQNPSATAAANRTKYRHATRTMPNTVAVLWFDHYGTYGDPPERANWGHVVIYVPGRGFASSSPVYGEYSAPYWYSSIEAVERAFNCSFRFWTEDINGKRICRPAPSKPAAKPTPVVIPEGGIDVIYWRTDPQGAVYPIDLVRRKKGKGLTRTEWEGVKSAYAAAGLKAPPIANVSKAVLDGIPFA